MTQFIWLCGLHTGLKNNPNSDTQELVVSTVMRLKWSQLEYCQKAMDPNYKNAKFQGDK
ncbi:MAG: hypothetical protein GY799_21095 [Desulfobulbaceae bacterium]|nr:hypothetical protein [Desulfobulbaceae bacterium]